MSGNWYSDLLLEDFEDLLPSGEMSETEPYVRNAAVEIAVDSDTSSDVVIVEELSQVSNSRIDRVLRPRTSLNAFHLRCFSPPPSTSKVYRSRKMTLDQQLVWWTLAFFVVAASAEANDGDYVWMTDPQTHERYQVLRSSYDRDKAFFLGESTLSDRFSHAYLDALANQCNAVTGPPSVFEFLNHTSIAVAEFCLNPEIYPYSFEIYLRLFETIRWGPYTIAALVAVLFTVARYLCTKLFLKTKVGRRFTTEHSQKKAMTPLWNTISYTFLFSVETGTLLNCGYNDFVYPLCIFKDIHFKRHRPLYYYLEAQSTQVTF